MSSESLVIASDFSCGYAGQAALHQINFTIGKNRTTALLGPGGAGKSTLLQAIARLHHFDPRRSGNEVWQDGSLAGEPQESISVLRQKSWDEERSLLTLVRDAGYADELTCLRETWTGFPQAVELLLPVIDLATATLPRHLARLATLTACIATRATLILLDEPDVGLGEPLLDWVAGKLAEMRGTRGLVVATHHLEFARRVSDDALLLINGALIEAAPTEELFTNPRHPRTQSFVRYGS